MKPDQALTGDLLDEEQYLTAEELCRQCALDLSNLQQWVQEGIVDAIEGSHDTQGATIESWRFTVTSIRRVRTAARLQRDLGVNLAGAALALELLDRIAELERRLR